MPDKIVVTNPVAPQDETTPAVSPTVCAAPTPGKPRATSISEVDQRNGDPPLRMGLLMSVIATVSVFAIVRAVFVPTETAGHEMSVGTQCDSAFPRFDNREKRSSGLSYPLLTLVLQRQGYAADVIGLNAAAMPLGLFLLSPLLPPLTARFGMIAVGIGCNAGTGLLMLGLLVLPHIEAWFVLRFLLGGTIAGAFIISETWINQLATPRNRGRLIGLYATIVAAGFATGPAILTITGSQGMLPFLIMAGLAIGSSGAIWLFRHDTPTLERQEGASIRRFLLAAPVLVLATGTVALFEQSALSLLPLYFLEFGMTERLAAAALTALIAGNIVFQLPLGWLADRTGSRRVMLICIAVGAIGPALLPLAAADGWALGPLLLVWGAAAYGVYTSALIELGHRFTGTMLVAGNACFGALGVLAA